MGILIIMVIIIIKNNTSISIIKEPILTVLDYSISLGAQTAVAIDLLVSALGSFFVFSQSLPFLSGVTKSQVVSSELGVVWREGSSF